MNDSTSILRRSDPTGPRTDLTFLPVDNGSPRLLDTDQIEHYNEHGFIAPMPILSPDEAGDVRRYIDGLLAAVAGHGDRRNSYSINSYHVMCAGLHDLVTDPRITGRAADILGDEIVCWGTHLFAKMPGDGKEVPFHQDAVFWPLTPSRSVTLWLAIDDVDTDNAAMQFVPGSHSVGALDHVERSLDGSRVLGREVDPDGPNGIARFGDARFDDVMPAGWASMHADMLLHGSPPNTSERRRAGLTLRYTAASTRLLDGYDYWRKSGVHVEAGDPAGFWYDRRRPDGEQPDKMADFWGEFDGQTLDAG